MRVTYANKRMLAEKVVGRDGRVCARGRRSGDRQALIRAGLVVPRPLGRRAAPVGCRRAQERDMLFSLLSKFVTAGVATSQIDLRCASKY